MVLLACPSRTALLAANTEGAASSSPMVNVRAKASCVGEETLRA
jgi:hypothetical protein